MAQDKPESTIDASPVLEFPGFTGPEVQEGSPA